MKNDFGSGTEVVPVLVEGRCDPEEMSFSEFVDYCKNPQIARTSPTLYLKDWHFQRR